MRLRREKFDNRRRVDLTDSQADHLDAMADELKMSFMGYVRKLVDDDMKRFSSKASDSDTPKQGQNSTQPNGLFTAEQVALLINTLAGKK